jgi:peptidoglycan/xylan/chitin deacetylase (PgdA/CDA1 family)
MKKTIVFLLAVAFVFASCKSADSASTADSKTPKLCALTFDDGPNVDKTPLVLEKLEKHKVVATFFLVGQLVNDETKPVLDRAAALGCEFGNHSWGWASMNQMSTEEIKESVSMTAAAIKKYTGQTPRFFRPPNLATSDEMYDAIASRSPRAFSAWTGRAAILGQGPREQRPFRDEGRGDHPPPRRPARAAPHAGRARHPDPGPEESRATSSSPSASSSAARVSTPRAGSTKCGSTSSDRLIARRA